MTRVVEIVRLAPDDWEAHRDLRLEALTTDPEAFGATYAQNAAYDEATWRSRLAAVTYWQAREAGMPLGMVGLWDPQTDLDDLAGDEEAEVIPFLIAMFVRPSARRRGIGAALVEAASTEAAVRGHRRLLLDVREANEVARAHYRRMGFIETDERTADPAHGRCELSMVRELP